MGLPETRTESWHFDDAVLANICSYITETASLANLRLADKAWKKAVSDSLKHLHPKLVGDQALVKLCSAFEYLEKLSLSRCQDISRLDGLAEVAPHLREITITNEEQCSAEPSTQDQVIPSRMLMMQVYRGFSKWLCLSLPQGSGC